MRLVPTCSQTELDAVLEACKPEEDNYSQEMADDSESEELQIIDRPNSKTKETSEAKGKSKKEFGC